jgi:ABC-type microcin C transport system permease subunit YejB
MLFRFLLRKLLTLVPTVLGVTLVAFGLIGWCRATRSRS